MNADEFCHGFFAFVLSLMLISFGFLLGYITWGTPIYENCVNYREAMP